MPAANVMLLSGGMDSCVALFWALHQSSTPVDGLFVDYNQIAVAAERNAALAVWEQASRNYPQVRLLHTHSVTMLAAASVTGDSPVDHYHSVDEAVRNTSNDKSYLPIRNAVLVSFATQLLLRESPEGGRVIIGTRGRGDAPGGFPDCTAEFARSMSGALTVASGVRVHVFDPLNLHAPSRALTIKMAQGLPGCMAALAHTVSCFHGTDCQQCLPCLRRAQAFQEMGIKDPAR